MKNLATVAVCLTLLCSPCPSALGAPPESGAGIDNLRAFAKLYGYVRYFHPSDAAAETDWDAFVRHGVEQVRNAESSAELQQTLEALFGSIAPTVRIYPSGEPPPPSPVLAPESTAGLEPVAWQHWGVDVGFPRGMYRSARLNRPDPKRPAFGTVTQGIDDAAPYRGREVRLRAAVKTEVEGDDNRGQLWLRVDRPGGEQGFFDNMEDRPITKSKWATYEIVGPVADDAVAIYVGGFLHGSGTVWLDDFELSVRDEGGDWQPVPVVNGGFEEGTDADRPPGWSQSAEDAGYDYLLTPETADEGRQAMRIRRDPNAPQTLFKALPPPGKTVEKTLGRGLAARIPVSLYSRDDQTLRPADAPSPEALRAALAAVAEKPATAADPAVRAGGVIIAWNVFQHFYPYHAQVETDWEGVLREGLARVLAGTEGTYPDTLRWLAARLEDGHAGVMYRDLPGGRLPIRLRWLDDRLVLVAVPKAESCVRRGDLLTAVDGEPAAKRLERARDLLSGTPRWRTYRALTEIGRGAEGTEVVLTVERGGEEHTCTVERVGWQGVAEEERPEPIAELTPRTFYVDLTRAEWTTVEARLGELAQADGVIFDLRGYPTGANFQILPHLSDETVRSNRFEVSQTIYPDRERVTWGDAGRWELPPREPRIAGRVIFLTDESAISYAESIMGIVEAHELGEILGGPTAGANGNVNSVTLFDTWGLSFTGMRVTKHDGSPHHLVGVRPTVSVKPTLEGVRAGRDEVLEAALERLSRGSESR